MRSAGFEVRSEQVLPLFNSAWDPNTYSAQMIDLIAAFLARHGGIERDDVTRWADELKAAGKSGEYFFSLNRYVFVAQAA
jgi:hypothetical protein